MVRIDADTIAVPKAVRLRVHGQLDLDASRPFGECLTWVRRLRRAVEIDLSEVDFIDGYGLSLLMEAYSYTRAAGRELTIIGASPCVRRLVALADASDRLPRLCSSTESRGSEQAEAEIVVGAREFVGVPTFRV